VIAHPTHILRTTRCGKRDPVRWLNQPTCQDKLEPNRRRGRPGPALRIGEPAPKNASKDRVVESVASSLLVILHYLLKNNIHIYVELWAGPSVPPRPSVDMHKFTFGGGQLG
jgi:hypothetical protein